MLYAYNKCNNRSFISRIFLRRIMPTFLDTNPLLHLNFHKMSARFAAFFQLFQLNKIAKKSNFFFCYFLWVTLNKKGYKKIKKNVTKKKKVTLKPTHL